MSGKQQLSDKKLRVHKVLQRPWHKTSGLVFKSKDERVVIGRMEGDDFVDLDDVTIDLAANWEFQLDPTLVDEEESEEAEETAEAEETEEAAEDVETEEAAEDVETEEAAEDVETEEAAEVEETVVAKKTADVEEITEDTVDEEEVEKAPIKVRSAPKDSVRELPRKNSDENSSLRFDINSLVDQVFSLLGDSQARGETAETRLRELEGRYDELQARCEKAEKTVKVLKKALQDLE